VKFVYTDALWHGTDMIGLGVASFSHFGGVHFQNAHGFPEYVAHMNEGKLPIYRALRLTPKQKLIREMILQLKTGGIELDYFKQKFGADVLNEFAEPYEKLMEAQMLERKNGSIALTRQGLLRVDSFLNEFFEPENRNVRYT
jgi:oxygen-independent coproporphyrinogen-3 oxidase